jgi:hypothetical protein
MQAAGIAAGEPVARVAHPGARAIVGSNPAASAHQAARIFGERIDFHDSATIIHCPVALS